MNGQQVGPDTFVLDSVTHLTEMHRGAAVLCASHGGAYAGYYAAKQGIGAVILNDAGLGREDAGIGGLKLLEALDVPAATVSSMTAEIGRGGQSIACGVISFINAPALRVGVVQGMMAREALQMLAGRPLQPARELPIMAEARFAITTFGTIRVIGVDSISLVASDDVGQIVVCGSHGGLLGGNPETAIKYEARAAVFNDAGGGAGNAGVSRLPALDVRGIAAACVSHLSARIGDARSTWEDGIISAVNATAAAKGGGIGQSCRAFAGVMALSSA